MLKKIHVQKKDEPKLSSISSNTGVQKGFESRPFVSQQKLQPNSQQPSLKTSLKQTEDYGHHLQQINSIDSKNNNQTSQALQPKLEPEVIQHVKNKSVGKQKPGTLKESTSNQVDKQNDKLEETSSKKTDKTDKKANQVEESSSNQVDKETEKLEKKSSNNSEKKAEQNKKKKPVEEMNQYEINLEYNKLKIKNIKQLKKIVWQGHLDAIAKVCQKNKYTIAIRETGPLSVKRIEQGAKAKPHTILEKSIKESSIKKGYGKDAEPTLEKITKLNLDGFVGHWNKQGQLIGIRVDGIKDEIKDRKLKKEDIDNLNLQKDGSISYIPLDLSKNDGGKAINKLKQIPNWQTYLYTGDYDLHEVYTSKGGGPGNRQIAEASKEKVNLLNQLNQGIADSGKDKVKREGKAELSGEGDTKRIHTEGAHAMFQHGDQATYRMNQHLEAKENKEKEAKEQGENPKEKEYEKVVASLVEAVATESDEPIAWCRMGEWTVTLNKREHDIFRIQNGLKKPHTWTPEGEKKDKAGNKVEKKTERFI